MKTTMEINNCITDFKILKKPECEKANLVIYSALEDLLIHNEINKELDDDSIFGFHLEFRKKTIMFNIKIDDLELFASSILKQIEIVRKNYGEHIKKQSDMGCII